MQTFNSRLDMSKKKVTFIFYLFFVLFPESCNQQEILSLKQA